MNDKSSNPEGTNSEKQSGEGNLQNSPHNGREDLISDKGAYSTNEDSSGLGFASGTPRKTGNHEASFKDSPQNKEIENKSLSMNSDPSPQRKKHNLMPYVLVVLALIAVIMVSIAVISFSLGAGGDLRSSEKVAVIYVQGTILSGNVPTGLGYATSEEISENIRRAVADSGVKAIVLRINSSGGSPAAAQEIAGEIEKAREKGIPVVVSMGDLATSAAYYISAPTDYIIANPSTNTGSIGVIWVFQNKSASYEEGGIDHYIAKSGELKDMGSNWRGLTDEEKEYADAVVMESYEDFITEVSEGRNISRSEVKKIADGRIYTGARAKELGLVDGLGNLYDAIDKAAELGGIEGEPRVEYMNRVSISRLLLGSGSGGSNETVGQFVSYFEESPYGRILA